jgi:DNA-binding CsgD family transcriptional regulator
MPSTAPSPAIIDTAKAIFRMRLEGKTVQEIARNLGITDINHMVSCYYYGTWFTPAEIRAMRTMRVQNYTLRKIAEAYGRTEAAVYYQVKRISHSFRSPGSYEADNQTGNAPGIMTRHGGNGDGPQPAAYKGTWKFPPPVATPSLEALVATPSLPAWVKGDTSPNTPTRKAAEPTRVLFLG